LYYIVLSVFPVERLKWDRFPHFMLPSDSQIN
jgi:hypothetical protein